MIHEMSLCAAQPIAIRTRSLMTTDSQITDSSKPTRNQERLGTTCAMIDVFCSASSAHSSSRQESRPLHDFTWPAAATRTCVIIDSDQEFAGYPLYDYLTICYLLITNH